MTRKYFGTDGIRGTVGQYPITPDFVLRLAHAVGPAPEMARLVRQHDLGVVADDFDLASFVRALSTLDADAVRAGKQASHDHARELSSEQDEAVASAVVTSLLAAGG